MQVSELLPRVARAVRTHVPDAPAPMLLSDLALAASHMFQVTKTMDRQIVLDLQQGVPDYLLDECPGDGLRWHEIAAVSVNGQPFDPVPSFRGVAECVRQGAKVSWDREGHTVLVAPTPKLDSAGGLVVTMVVTTDGKTTTELPDTLLADIQMQDALVAGAVARVLGDLMPKAAGDYRIQYDRALTSIVTRRLQGWGSAEAKMTARGFIAR